MLGRLSVMNLNIPEYEFFFLHENKQIHSKGQYRIFVGEMLPYRGRGAHRNRDLLQEKIVDNLWLF